MGNLRLSLPLSILLVCLGCGADNALSLPGSQAALTATPTRFAVIGDFGTATDAARDVAELVRSWQPDFILTLGDNNYPEGAAATLDENVGQLYHDYIAPYSGAFGRGADTNRFFPILGNHDWDTEGAAPYLDYFHLPHNGRYYDVRLGPVHFFCVDSDTREPDGITADSLQGQFMASSLQTSTAPWKIVLMHHAPFASGRRGGEPDLQWPFAAWGAQAVFSGHHHLYERLADERVTLVINGLGGARLGRFGTVDSHSHKRYNDDHGALLVTATSDRVTGKFVTRAGLEIDAFTLLPH